MYIKIESKLDIILVGHYCGTGCEKPTACPRGTFQPEERKVSRSSCLVCDADLYCRSPGLARPIYSIWSTFRRISKFPFPETMPWPN